MSAVIVVRGGIAEVETGAAVIIDFDNIGADVQAGQDALELLYRRRGVQHLRDHIYEVWPGLRP